MGVSTDREDVDTWAPVGSVLGDPLMGSPLFDVAVLDDLSGHRLKYRETVRGGRAVSAEGVRSGCGAGCAGRGAGAGYAARSPAESAGGSAVFWVRAGAAVSGQRPQGARQPARMPVQQLAPVPQSPYSRRPGPPVGYGGRPGQPMGYGGGPGGPVGHGGASGAPGRLAGSGLPRRPVGSGRPLPAGADPYALSGVYGRPGRKKSIGPYVGWIIFFLFFIIWHIVR